MTAIAAFDAVFAGWTDFNELSGNTGTVGTPVGSGFYHKSDRR